MNNMIDGEHNQLVEDMCETDKELKQKIISECCEVEVNKALRRIGKQEYICEKCGRHCDIKPY